MPAIEDFLAPFQVQFRQRKGTETLERYVTGLLNEHPNKNCDTLASVVPGTHPQRLHNLLTDLAWYEADLNRPRVERLLERKSEGDGVLLLDDTGFGKKGRHSVGVARQYSGTFGKVSNCQVTVICHYAERHLAWPVATRLYLPRAWAEDPERRKQAHVPPEVTFQTKAEIALGLLDEAKTLGIPHRAVVTDADYGDNPPFSQWLRGPGRALRGGGTGRLHARPRTHQRRPPAAGRCPVASRTGAGLANASLARGHPRLLAGEVHRPTLLSG